MEVFVMGAEKPEKANCNAHKTRPLMPSLVWLSWLSVVLQTKRLQLRFPIQGTYLGCGFGSLDRVRMRGNWSMFLSLSFSLPSYHSKNK